MTTFTRRSPADFLENAAEDVLVVGARSDRQRFVELCIATARTRKLGGGGRGFVSLPARELVLDEINGEFAAFEDLALAHELVGIVPAILVEGIREERRPERTGDLLTRLADLQPIDHVLRDEVTLVDVQFVDAQTAIGGAAVECQREQRKGSEGEKGA